MKFARHQSNLMHAKKNLSLVFPESLEYFLPSISRQAEKWPANREMEKWHFSISVFFLPELNLLSQRMSLVFLPT